MLIYEYYKINKNIKIKHTNLILEYINMYRDYTFNN